jgi:hypothetical protein
VKLINGGLKRTSLTTGERASHSFNRRQRKIRAGHDWSETMHGGRNMVEAKLSPLPWREITQRWQVISVLWSLSSKRRIAKQVSHLSQPKSSATGTSASSLSTWVSGSSAASAAIFVVLHNRRMNVYGYSAGRGYRAGRPAPKRLSYYATASDFLA